MFMKSVLRINIYFIFVDILKIVFILMIVIKKLDKMKDEFNGVKIDEFVGLKSKMYELIAENVNKAKAVNLKLKHKEYFDVLFDKKVLRHKMKKILSEKHSVSTYVIYKLSLSCFDDKRYVLDDGISTSAYGHEDIVWFFLNGWSL